MFLPFEKFVAKRLTVSGCIKRRGELVDLRESKMRLNNYIEPSGAHETTANMSVLITLTILIRKHTKLVERIGRARS
jgi:hypothetical protein